MAKSNMLFVYGTLRRGFALHGALQRSGAKLEGKGRIRARLFDLGDYPGAVPAIKSTDFVEGELYQLDSPSKQLSVLDGIEEFDPKRAKTSLFRRRLVSVRLASGRKTKAWAYFLNRRPRHARLVPHGDYAAASKRAEVSHSI
jgi:gamma-glutamylcyclotransferase (GGCT)/AIG2-like uncharacterized protein YtfP